MSDPNESRRQLRAVAERVLQFLDGCQQPPTEVELIQGVDWPKERAGYRKTGCILEFERLGVIRRTPEGGWVTGGYGYRWRGLSAEQEHEVRQALKDLVERLQGSGDPVMSLDELGIDDATLDIIRSAYRPALKIEWATRKVALDAEFLEVEVEDVVKRQEIPDLDPIATTPGLQAAVELKRREFDHQTFDWSELRGLTLTKQLDRLISEIGVETFGLERENRVVLKYLERITGGRIAPVDRDTVVMVGDNLDTPERAPMSRFNKALSALRGKYGCRRKGGPPGRPPKRRETSS